MPAATLLRDAAMTIVDYRCTAQPTDAPFVESHQTYTLAYVRRGSFSVRTRGKVHELVPGSLFIGHPGDEYTCLHDHHVCGDECLSFQLSHATADAIDSRTSVWQVAAVPPVAELVVLSELAQSVANGRSTMAIDEAGLLLAARFVEVVRGQRTHEAKLTARDRRRAADSARWIDDNAHAAVTLATAARHAGVSEFHFLRQFRAALGVTPHQYLVRCRLRRAARLLCASSDTVTDVAFECGFGDLSNFINTFTRAARMSPQRFRRVARAKRSAAVPR